jgi:hypothetical protein
MLATAALASGVALLAPTAAMAESTSYSGVLLPGQRQCVTASGTSATAVGSSSLAAAEFTVLFRPDGTTGFNQIDIAKTVSFNRSYSRARTGSFRFCAVDTQAFYNINVSLSLTTS